MENLSDGELALISISAVVTFCYYWLLFSYLEEENEISGSEKAISISLSGLGTMILWGIILLLCFK